MKGVQCYELFGGIALKTHTFSFSFFHPTNHVKFADDTVLIGLMSDDDSSMYVDEINKFSIYWSILV